MEICPVGAKLVNANGQINGQTDMTERIITIHNLRKRLERKYTNFYDLVNVGPSEGSVISARFGIYI